MIDFNDEKVKEMIGKVAKETGLSLEEIIKLYKNCDDNKEYVRFVKGENKGRVGIVFPSCILFPFYAKTVYCPDGTAIICPRWAYELVSISKEDYEKESKINGI